MTQEDRDELRQEMLEDARIDSLIETRMRYDLDFAVEQFDLYEAMKDVEDLVKKLNNYGHEISVSDLVRDYY
jgi:hypothetical protein